MAQARERSRCACVSLCFAFAGVLKVVKAAAFTLVWTHSVEKVDWQEDWLIESGRLQLIEARVKGTGAGMEPPPEARLVDSWWRWMPNLAPLPEVVLGNSGLAGEWRFCVDGKCRTLSNILGHRVGRHVTVMKVCDRSSQR
jgi:hypothetical protein